ncbi:MAG: hypothetical protein ACQET3_06420, partial [Promethearchaeati archaeon]
HHMGILELGEMLAELKKKVREMRITEELQYYLLVRPGLIAIIWGITLFLPLGIVSDYRIQGGEWSFWCGLGLYNPSAGEWSFLGGFLDGSWPISPVITTYIASVNVLLLAGALTLTLTLLNKIKPHLPLFFSGLSLAIHIVGSLSQTPFYIITNIQIVSIAPLFQLVISAVTIMKPKITTLSNLSLDWPFKKWNRKRISPPGTNIVRGAEFVGNRLRYKVKVTNTSDTVLTDVSVSIATYPRESLKLQGERTRTINKLEPNGFRSPSFEFLPTQDCVKGKIVSTVSYVDFKGEVHSAPTEPYTVRSVCDLLEPEEISPESFELRLSEMECGELAVEVEDWTPVEMYSKTIQVLERLNFFEVKTEIGEENDHVISRISGWSKGKYTQKNVGVEIIVTGRPGERGATAQIRMSGEDEAMIMPAIDEIAQEMSAWLCPMCGAKLPAVTVDELKAGRSVACPFCGVTMDR